MSVAVTPSVVQDIVETDEERQFWEVVRHHERPPFYDEKEGVGNRLNRAARIVYEDRLTPNSDGSYTVEGSEGHSYRVREHCSCPDSTYRKERGPCYHEIAVILYVEWQKRLHPRPPVEQTQREATLPLPPVSVEERIAQTPAQPPTTLKEPAMDDPYIPEPSDYDDAPVAVLEAPARVTALSPLPTPAHSLAQAMETWREQRAVVKRFLQQELTPNVDYYSLKVKGRDTKPTLSKAGAEKFSALFQVRATFTQDSATWEMLGRPHDTLFYVCHLHTRSGELVGEGRGARGIKQDGDLNKSIKMAQKSAMIDAVLRTGALSDVFTQDLEDETPAPEPAKRTPTSQELRSRIWAIVQERAPHIREREDITAWITSQTGYMLVPDHYQAILEVLRHG